ncbi:MAG TPA: DUF4349 domain-containing protein, partial [Thermoanaerobacterales bacterium]|nr:DUF4349 domain-containing protein [Thermoanaerobacterales bacterium]
LIIIGGQNLLNYKNVLPDFLQKAASPDMASGDAHYDTHNVLESSMEPEIKNYMSPDSGEMVAPRSASIDDGFTKKLIKRANIQLEVEELEQKLNEISQLVELKGGYVENSSVWSSTTTVEIQKNSNLLIRVPESSFDEVLFTIEEMGYTKSKNITGEDKTLEYIDIEARMRNMELHEEKLLMIMDKATNMQETIEIMREVGNIRADIESMKRQLKYLDNQIRFSTIDLDMFETSSPKSGINMRNYRGLWGRIVEAFILNVNNLINNGASILIYISSALPMVIVIAIIIVIILKIRRLFMNKRI